MKSGDPVEAFIAGVHAGQIDRNASPIELIAYIDGEIVRESVHHTGLEP